MYSVKIDHPPSISVIPIRKKTKMASYTISDSNIVHYFFFLKMVFVFPRLSAFTPCARGGGGGGGRGHMVGRRPEEQASDA